MINPKIFTVLMDLPEVEIRAKRLPKGTYENHFNKVHKLIKQYEFNDDKAKEHADAIVTTGINKKIGPYVYSCDGTERK